MDEYIEYRGRQTDIKKILFFNINRTLVNYGLAASQGFFIENNSSIMNYIDPSTYYIYVTTDLTNSKIYVGFHKLSSGLDYRGSGTELRKEIKNKGKHNFKTIIIDWYGLEDDALMAESYYILNFDAWDPSYGYNNLQCTKSIDKVYEWLQQYIIKTLSK
jgi:hypothetical protein